MIKISLCLYTNHQKNIVPIQYIKYEQETELLNLKRLKN